MAKIHVLRRSGHHTFTVAVHVAVPNGNNAAGTAWSDAIKNSGRATSIMEVGNGAGQITQAEMDQITAGTVVEGVFQWGDNSAWTNPQRLADLDLRADQLASELLARLADELQYFGFTRT